VSTALATTDFFLADFEDDALGFGFAMVLLRGGEAGGRTLGDTHKVRPTK
jgi:hypothetical protein